MDLGGVRGLLGRGLGGLHRSRVRAVGRPLGGRVRTGGRTDDAVARGPAGPAAPGRRGILGGHRLRCVLRGRGRRGLGVRGVVPRRRRALRALVLGVGLGRGRLAVPPGPPTATPTTPGPAGTVVLRVRVLRGLGLLGLRDRVLVLGGLGGGRLGLLLRLTGLIGGLGGAVVV